MRIPDEMTSVFLQRKQACLRKDVHSYLKPSIVDFVREDMKREKREILKYVNEDEDSLKMPLRVFNAHLPNEHLTPDKVIPLHALKQSLEKTNEAINNFKA
jgi:hypothetical protein